MKNDKQVLTLCSSIAYYLGSCINLQASNIAAREANQGPMLQQERLYVSRTRNFTQLDALCCSPCIDFPLRAGLERLGPPVKLQQTCTALAYQDATLCNGGKMLATHIQQWLHLPHIDRDDLCPQLP